MSSRTSLEPVFILHRRPYRNTSLILELFSKNYGRVSVIARSARGTKSRFRGVLQLLTPMVASWSGQSELKALTQVELLASPYPLTETALFCSFYIHELLMRLLHRDDPYPKLFDYYQQALQQLADQSDITTVLRRFEKQLLMELGYGLPFHEDAATGEPILATARYQYLPERGFLRCEQLFEDTLTFSGKTLLALAHETFTDDEVKKESKRLIRMILSRHLGNKPLKSRDLLR